MTDMTNMMVRFDQSLSKVSDWMEVVVSVDFNFVDRLSEFIPDPELKQKLTELIQPIFNFLSNLIDEIINLLDAAFNGLMMIIDQIKNLEIIGRFSNLLFKSLDVLKNITDSINSLATSPLINLGAGNTMHDQFLKVKEFIQNLISQIPDHVVLANIQSEIGTIKNKLIGIKAKLP